MDLDERLRESEQSRRLAWQILQEIRAILEVLGDERIPYEEQKRFRREGDFLVRALLNEVTTSRLHIYDLERGIHEFKQLLSASDLTKEARQSFAQLAALCRGTGLSNEEIQERLDRLKELHVLAET